LRIIDADKFLQTLPNKIREEIDNCPTLFPSNMQNMTLKEMKDLRNSLDLEIAKAEDEKREKLIEEKAQYVGKCYQFCDIDNKFIKVISKFGEVLNEVTVLEFSTPICYKFREIYDSNFHRHKSCCEFEFYDDVVKSINVEFLNSHCKEIKEEEFEKGAYEYMKQLLLVCRELKEN